MCHWHETHRRTDRIVEDEPADEEEETTPEFLVEDAAEDVELLTDGRGDED
jgi:hypothetical protein